jgi:beta-lactamase regulating signal transducer with metallopeptidase domain
MNLVVAYIIKSVIASGVLWGYYCMALRNKKFHAYNRFYLLAAIVISLAVPLINFNWFTVNSDDNNSITTILTALRPEVKAAASGISTSTVLYVSAALVSVMLFAILFAKVWWVYNAKRRHKNTRMNGYNLIETNLKQAPFSFLNNLFWKQSITLDNEDGTKIFRHELAHIRGKHTYDKLFMQAVVCICWMNPFYWLMQRELNMIHEFIADAGCISEGDAESFAKMLLQAHNEGRYLEPYHQFFHSPIKRRLIMITTSNKTPYSYARRVLALPVTALVLAMFSFTVGHSQTNQPAKQDTAPQTIEEQKIIKNKMDSKGLILKKENGTIIIKGDSTKAFYVKIKKGDNADPKLVLEKIQNNNGDSVISIKLKNGEVKKYIITGKSGEEIKLSPVKQ